VPGIRHPLRYAVVFGDYLTELLRYHMTNEEIPVAKKKSGGKGAETLFRVTYSNQISHIRIADNKAHLILYINAGIISVIMAVSGLTRSIESFDISSLQLIIPVLFIVLACLTSAVFAIRAAMPNVRKPKKVPANENHERSSLLFFGNISSKSMEQYMTEMEDLLVSKRRIHENMIVDIYNQAKILSRKYKLLNVSYQIFMYGIIVGVLSYILILFYDNLVGLN
jgi:hypothetical protein